MGFLSFLPLMQQAGAYQYFTRPQQGQVVPNQPGVLTAAYNQQPQPQPRPRSPFAAAPAVTAPELQMTAGAALPDMGQMKPPAIQPQPGLGQRFATAFGSGEGSVFNSPLFNLGLSLLGNAQGSNWGGVAQDMQGFQANQLQRQRYQAQMRRDKVTDQREGQRYNWEAADRQERDRARAAWEANVNQLAQTNPTEAARVRSLGFENYAQYALNEDEQTFRAEQAQMDRDASIRAANIASANRRDPTDSIQYRSDLARLSDMGTAANFATSYVIPRLERARQIITRLAEIGGMDNPLSADRRIQLSQLGQFGTEARGLLQELGRIQTEFTVQDARALAPVSNTDFGRLMQINPNGDMTVDAAFRIVDDMASQVQRGVETYNAAAQWTDRYQGLTGTLDPEGRTFEQAQYQASQQARQQPQAQTQTAAPTRSSDTLPSPSGLRDGTTARDSRTGRTFVVRNGQWEPQRQWNWMTGVR